MESLHELDLSLFRAINIDLHRSWLDPFFAFFSYLGLGQICGAACLLFAFSKSTRRFVLPLLIADAVGGFLVADVLKILFPRDRPSHLSFAIREEPHLASSFPSGHTTTAFAIAAMMWFLTRETPRASWGWISLVAAGLVGVSRIYRGVHWPTDVVAGIMCGIGTACTLYLLLPKFGLKLTEDALMSEIPAVSS